MTRTFQTKTATRSAVPLLVGLAGPSDSGKTYSALRLATGMQRVTGGEIFVIDTEARRAAHYADEFSFQHLDLTAPFGSLDYLAAIEHCVKAGAKIIVIDSMSHEHEGPGGLLEQHAAAVEERSKGDYRKAEKVKMLCWAAPKAARRRLLNSMIQTGASVICCFRAKEKLRMRPGKEPERLGWMPIAGEEFVYEMTANVLLPPSSHGVPDWAPSDPGEKATVKLPRQFGWLRNEKGPLSEGTGERMAKWAAGVDTPSAPVKTKADWLLAIENSPTEQALAQVGRILKVSSKAIAKSDLDEIRATFESRLAALRKPPRTPTEEGGLSEAEQAAFDGVG